MDRLKVERLFTTAHFGGISCRWTVGTFATEALPNWIWKLHFSQHL